MRSTLIACFCFFATSLHAEIISTNNSETIPTTTPTSNTTNSSIPLSEIDQELAKIASDCLNARDYEHILGDHVRSSSARVVSSNIIPEITDVIGLEELRAALKLPAPGPWQYYNSTDPSEQELESASTIEEYYNLKEPKSYTRNLNNTFIFEHNVATAVKFFDERLPSIRIIFKKTIEEKLSSAPKVIDKKTVDDLIGTFYPTVEKVDKAISKLRSRNFKCWEEYKENLKT